MADLSIIILAGGLGSRLRSVLPETPKVLAPIHGRPFLEYLLTSLLPAQPAEFILCLAYMAPQIREAIGDHFMGVPVFYTVEKEPLGTGGAIRLGLQQSSRPWSFVLNGDSVCRVLWPDLKSRYLDSVHPSPAMVVTQVPDVSRYGRVELDADHNVRSFFEKDSIQSPGFINAGIYALPKTALEWIPGTGAVSFERDILPLLIMKKLRAFVSPGPFIDIGTPQSYAAAASFFENT